MLRGLVIQTTRGCVEFLTSPADVKHLDTQRDGRNAGVISLLIESYMCLLADSPLNSTSVSEKPPRLFREFYRQLMDGDLLSTIKEFSNLAHRLVSTTTLYGSGTSTGDWIPEMTRLPIFREYHHWYKTGDIACLRYVYNFLVFAKKAKYDDPSMNATAFRGWLDVEERLSGLVLPVDTCDALRIIVGALVPSIVDRREFRPRYGPGRTAEKGLFGIVGKSNSLAYDAKLDRAFFRSHFVSYGLRGDLGLSYSTDQPGRFGILPDPCRWADTSTVSRRSSRLRFVPKDITKSRSICAEPNSYMFFQQGLSDQLVSGMRKTIARRFVDITDQSRNRNLAQAGSMTGEIDTIDLSSASDSVSVELVRKIFPRELLYFLLATRTASVELHDGTTVSVKKFAPMGSALCFPIQCLVFTSVVILAAMQRAEGKRVGESIEVNSRWLQNVDRSVNILFDRYEEVITNLLNGDGYHVPGSIRNHPAAVYGDDICVDSQLTPYVTHILQTLGFTVNISKSFRGSQCFRESCGGYYYNGEDVTPMYFRVEGPSKTGVITPNGVATMIAGANHAGDRGYRHVRRRFIHHLLFGKISLGRYKATKNDILFSDNRDLTYAVWSDHVKNDHLRSRYSADLQRDEIRCVTLGTDEWVEPDSETLYPVESYLYQRWWASHASGINAEDYSFAALRCDAVGYRLRRRWIPT